MNANLKNQIESGYRQAYKFAKAHYENFPVVSLLIPARLRKDISVIYWFARTADDYADEGNAAPIVKLENLKDLEDRLNLLLNSNPSVPMESALRQTILAKNINPQYFYKLLKAFRQDVIKSRYSDFDELLEYCSNSANPVGRILLELFNIRDEKAFYFSDRICSALQLTNFLQDTKIDFEKGRIYYPMNEMLRFGVTEDMFEMKEINFNLKKLIEFSVCRVQSMFDEGKGLLEFLSGRFKYEILWTIKSGEEILNVIRGADFDVFTKRPFLSKIDFVKLLFKSLIKA